jgi:hypothetical protein
MKERLPFIDWMKCLGMLVIVYGHTAGIALIEFTSPFNPKQLGVAFFVFVMGFSLARETRPARRTVYNRYFEMALFGWIAALLVSVFMFVTTGDLAESNYLPMFLGVNVFFDFFPANPTTWFIGTYLHLLLFWAVISRRIIYPLWALLAILIFEIVARSLLIEYVGSYVAYMLITNWIGIFVLGTYVGQRPLSPSTSRSAALAAFALTVLAVAWPLLTSGLETADTFPFRTLSGPLIWTSVSISLLYWAYTLAFFHTTRWLPDLSIVRLIARNTLIVFIVHMPLVYWFTPTLYRWVPPGWPRVIMNLVLFFLLLSLVSEALRNLVRPVEMRDLVAARVASLSRRRDIRDSASEKTP